MLNPLYMLSYVTLYFMLKKHHNEYLAQYKFTREEKRNILQANKEILVFFCLIGQRLLTEIIGGFLFNQTVEESVDNDLSNIYYYYSVLELISEIVMLAGICLSIRRALSTMREHSLRERSIMRSQQHFSE